MELLAPLVKSRKYGKPVPVYLVYNHIMNNVLNLDKAETDEKREQIKKHREKIIKTTVLIDAPEEYWHLGYCRDTGTDYQAFCNLPLEIRAKLIAERSLSNMVEIVDRHLEIMEEKRREQLKSKPNHK